VLARTFSYTSGDASCVPPGRGDPQRVRLQEPEPEWRAGLFERAIQPLNTVAYAVAIVARGRHLVQSHDHGLDFNVAARVIPPYRGVLKRAQ
jgi:hypothetical protein